MPGCVTRSQQNFQTSGCSIITVRHSLSVLTDEGLIRRERGRGTFVSSQKYSPRVPASIRASISGLIENLMAMGLKTKAELIEFGYVTAMPDMSDLLELPSDAVVQYSAPFASDPFRICPSPIWSRMFPRA